jgi:hypothetical protein
MALGTQTELKEIKFFQFTFSNTLAVLKYSIFQTT